MATSPPRAQTQTRMHQILPPCSTMAWSCLLSGECIRLPSDVQINLRDSKQMQSVFKTSFIRLHGILYTRTEYVLLVSQVAFQNSFSSEIS